MRHPVFLVAALASLLGASGVSWSQDPPKPSAEDIRFFESRIRPLLATHCTSCHGEKKSKSDLRLDTLLGMLTGGKAGPAIVPGKPAQSLLITAVGYRDNELKMPPKKKLSDREISDLKLWVKRGAPHPDHGRVTAPVRRSQVDLDAGRRHWAFQTPVKPEVPRTSEAETHPIDAFISARLSRKGLAPLGRADRRTLIRRATFDLTGLPPTPEEIDAFLRDKAPNAFARVVDRLLASPHYGERWARHWLDIARYADSNGMDENIAHANAWRYRDYVVNAFNADKPYNSFLVEQLAGDLLDSGDDRALRHERLIATGFLLLGPKVLAEPDATKMEMDIVDEQVDSIGRGLMGLTLGCARCHDHKFDPIGQDDYYGLAGIFKSTRSMESFEKIARWNENSLALEADLARKKAHDEKVSAKKKVVEERFARAYADQGLKAPKKTPKEIDKRFAGEVRRELKKLRDELKKLEDAAPVMPSAMGVGEGEVADVEIHIRGSHLTLGETVQRRFPRVLTEPAPKALPEDRSGRLEFARWLTHPSHPLTARVMVNRLWRWHFGKGLVNSVDNFGLKGDAPSHPDLLDWLSVRFVEDGWSLKKMHRVMMLSETYRRQSGHDEDHARKDPENTLYGRRDLRRLEAEAIRDALLAISGRLDRTLGGSLLKVKNREFIFNHTSEDKSTYDTRRRSLYVPVVRNHLFDAFQLFDYTDAGVLNGDRDTSTIAPQALFLMNSELVGQLSGHFAKRLLKTGACMETRIRRLFLEAYGRPPSKADLERAKRFLDAMSDESPERAWQALCQAVVCTSEFIYLR